jgi:hypothetical protein
MSQLDTQLASTSISAGEGEVVEENFRTEQVIEIAKSDLNFLAGLALREAFVFFFPPIFIAVWKWLLQCVHEVRTFPKLALGLPRGFGKTTVIKLFVLYCILFTTKKFIVIISSNSSLAEAILMDVIGMLDDKNIKALFGDWRVGAEIDRQDLKVFGFRGRNVILRSVGVGTGIRGINYKMHRPDVMIFEDAQTREAADSETESNNIYNWMLGTAMKAKSPFGCMYLFIGNMYPTPNSILRKLKTNSQWTKYIVGGILSDGSSLWEELHPLKQLLQEFQHDLESGKPEIFYSEVLNDENASVNNLIDISKIPKYPYTEHDMPQGGFILIDPATDKKDADAVSVGLFEMYDATPALTELEEGSFSPGDTIRKAITMALSNNIRLIVIESNAYQYTLKYWFDFICQQLGIYGLEAVEIYSGHYSKNSRIINMFKQLLAGEVRVHPNCSPQVNLQITNFNPLRRDNTDGILDLLAYAPRVPELYSEFISSQYEAVVQEGSQHEVVDAIENCPF